MKISRVNYVIPVYAENTHSHAHATSNGYDVSLCVDDAKRAIGVSVVKPPAVDVFVPMSNVRSIDRAPEPQPEPLEAQRVELPEPQPAAKHGSRRGSR